MDKFTWNYDGKDNEASAADGYTQFKIYTAESYFYIGENKDSVVSFGVGSYTQKDANNMEEVNIFNTTTLDTAATVKLAITKNEKGYNQKIDAIVINGAKWSSSEDYIKVIIRF